ncbi:MAG: dynamin family protein [Deltaproteobacteria bacterium]|nr:dynamin family protein [Deltaproteobacteria bacterium]
MQLPAGALESFRERKLDVQLALQDLSDVAGALGAATLKERLDRELVKKLEEDRFHLVVVGEFNHGKTTFVNALLGASILPTGVTPTTATIHHLRYGTEPSAKVVFAGGREDAIEFERVRSFVVGGEAATEQVQHIEVSYPAALLQERIVLVDTPGVNDLSLQRADITYSYIPQSDAVLFLLDAGQILKESERAFLQDKIIGQARDKIVFVITKWDLLSESEQAEALKYAKDQLAKFVKGEPIVYPVSAQKALGGDATGSGMPELLEYLTRFLAEHRGRILLDNALGEGLTASATLAKGVDAKRRALSMDERELARRISAIESDLAGQGATIEQRRSKIREEVSSVRAWARRDLDRFVDDASRMILAQVDKADPQDLKVFFPGYLEHVVKTWAEAETKEIGAALEGIAERTIAIVREDAHDTAKRVGDQLGGQLPGLKIEVDSFAFDIGVMASLVLGLSSLFSGAIVAGALMLVAAPIIGMFARDRIHAEYKRNVRERTPQVLREIATKVGPKIDEMINEFADKLDAWVVSASEDLHRELLEVLESARDARKAGVEKSAEGRAETEVASAKLVKARARLEQLRAGLWGDAVRSDEAEVAANASQPGQPPISGSGQGTSDGGPPPPVNTRGGAA